MKREVLDFIAANLKDGDIINTAGKAKWWEIHLHIAYAAIRNFQQELFGKKADWMDTHTVIKLSKGVFSTEPPKALWVPVEKYFAREDIRYTVYRIAQRPLDDGDVAVLNNVTGNFVGRKYDYGQLLDILFNGILGYPDVEKVKWFDAGSRQKVCSVSIAAIFQKFRQMTGDSIKRLFSEINPLKWDDKEFVKRYQKAGKGWDVEQTTPAHFANSDFFSGEIVRVFRIEGGRII